MTNDMEENIIQPNNIWGRQRWQITVIISNDKIYLDVSKKIFL